MMGFRYVTQWRKMEKLSLGAASQPTSQTPPNKMNAIGFGLSRTEGTNMNADGRFTLIPVECDLVVARQRIGVKTDNPGRRILG